MDTETSPKTSGSCCGIAAKDLGPTLAFLSLRVWLGLRALLTGIEKFGAKVTKSVTLKPGDDGYIEGLDLETEIVTKEYGFEHYHGVPGPLYEKFQEQPLIPGWGLSLYDALLGYGLIGLGALILLGVLPRLALFASALLYASLTVGLILIASDVGDAGISWLGVHVIMTAGALCLADKNRFALYNKW